MPKGLSGFVIASAVCLLAGHAAAQARDNYFARDRNISVRERGRPGYDARGLHVSSFMAYPKIELGLQENTNIYGQPNGAKSDAIGLINPEVDLVSHWSRNSLELFARSATREYVSHTAEDTTDWQFGGRGRLDLGNSTVHFGGDYGYLAEPRTATVGSSAASFVTVHPIQYYQSDANLDLVHTFNRLQVQGGVTFVGQQFQNARNILNAVVLENQFNNTHTVATGKAGYALSPDTAIYAAASYNIISYTNQTISASSLNRDSTGLAYDVGASFDLTELVRGDIEVGYLRQDYKAAAFGSVQGFHALGKLEWFPTDLTTVTFTGQRDVEPTTLVGSPSEVTASLGGQVDHELLRNLILTGGARYVLDDYQGVARHDRIGEFTVSGDYLMNRNIGLHLAYDYLTQESTGAARGVNFNDNRITLSTTLQY